MELSVWDVGGQEKARPLWRHHFEGCHGVVFVVDSNDRGRLDRSRAELAWLMAEDHLRSLPLLVLANKQDLPNTMTVEQVSEAHLLDRETSRRVWHVHPCVAQVGEGLFEGLDWLAEVMETGSPAFSTDFYGPPLLVTVHVGTGTQEQHVTFTNVAGAELAVLSHSEAAQWTLADVQRVIAECAHVEPIRVKFVLLNGDAVSARGTTPVSRLLTKPSSGEEAPCVLT